MTPISAYCLRASAGSAVGALEVAEHRHVLRQRDPVDRFLLGARSPRGRARGRTRPTPARRRPARSRGRLAAAACACASAGATPADRERGLAELHARPRLGLALSERGARARDCSAERAPATSPSSRRACPTRAYDETSGRSVGHRVERLEALAVAPELDERVADHAVVARRRRRDRPRAAAERERLAEAVPRERERAEAAGRDQVARREAQRPAQHLVGLRVVGRVARLARPLLVREPERVERAHVVAARAQLVLELRDLRRRVVRRGRPCDRGASSRCGEPCSAPPRNRAVAVSPAAAPPISNLRAFMTLLQPGRRGPPAAGPLRRLVVA